MAEESNRNDPSDTNYINQWAAENHCQGEAPECGAGNPANFSIGQTKLYPPRFYEFTSRGKGQGSNN